MTARAADDMPQTRAALRDRIQVLEELLAEARAADEDLKTRIAGAHESVEAEQRAQRDHALICRVVHRPTTRRTNDVPTQNLT